MAQTKALGLIILNFLTTINCQGQYSQSLVQRAENGIVSAQIELAKCYLDGNGVNKSESEALKWFEKASEKNNIEAMVACGDILCNEWPVDLEPDYIQGLKWYRKAAAKGNSKAKDFVSNFDSCNGPENVTEECPFTWLPCDEDLERSEYLKQNLYVIAKECSNNNPIATYYLAIIAYTNNDFASVVKYLSEIYPLVMDEDNYYEDILEQEEGVMPIGDILPAKVFSLLGWCYEYGQGVNKDYVKAAEYYLSDFDYSLSAMPMIPRVRGAYCYKKAGLYEKFINEVNTQGITFGSGGVAYKHLSVPCLKITLAEMYKTGEGVPQNMNKALDIYESIVDQRKGMLKCLGSWFPEIRSFSDIGKAAYRAAKMYRNGEGCKVDEVMAELYFEIALKYGNRSAWYEKQND